MPAASSASTAWHEPVQARVQLRAAELVERDLGAGDHARHLLTGEKVARVVTGAEVALDELGGPELHARLYRLVPRRARRRGRRHRLAAPPARLPGPGRGHGPGR